MIYDSKDTLKSLNVASVPPDQMIYDSKDTLKSLNVASVPPDQMIYDSKDTPKIHSRYTFKRYTQKILLLLLLAMTSQLLKFKML